MTNATTALDEYNQRHSDNCALTVRHLAHQICESRNVVNLAAVRELHLPEVDEAEMRPFGGSCDTAKWEMRIHSPSANDRSGLGEHQDGTLDLIYIHVTSYRLLSALIPEAWRKLRNGSADDDTAAMLVLANVTEGTKNHAALTQLIVGFGLPSRVKFKVDGDDGILVLRKERMQEDALRLRELIVNFKGGLPYANQWEEGERHLLAHVWPCNVMPIPNP